MPNASNQGPNDPGSEGPAPEFLHAEGEGDRQAEIDRAQMTETRENIDHDKPNDLAAEAANLRNQAVEADVAAREAKKSDEQKKAESLHREADLKLQEASAESQRNAVAGMARTVGEAGVVAPVPPDTSLHSHAALKRSNDPANPKPMNPEQDDEDGRTVTLAMDTPDGPRSTTCHPDLIGDYLRAGWRKVEGVLGIA